MGGVSILSQSARPSDKHVFFGVDPLKSTGYGDRASSSINIDIEEIRLLASIPHDLTLQK